MLNRLGVALSSIALVGLVFAPCLAFAADAVVASEKVETVNVTADATGAVEKVEVDVTLKNASAAAELLDVSDLTDIKGKDGATCAAAGDGLAWRADGEDVAYAGETSAQLPVGMKVTYRLDGQEVSPTEIAGKSGRVSIRYDFTNDSPFIASVGGASTEMRIPFTCITALMMNGDNFSDVEVTNGKIIDDGSDSIVMGYAMPGLKQSLGSLADDARIPDYFEVTATAKQFELKSTMTIVTAGLMADMDMSELGFDDLDGTSTGLSEGIAQLRSGADELSEGAWSLSGGADELSTGVEGLSQGLYALAYGKDGKSGLSKVSGSLKKLVSGLEEVDENLSAAVEQLEGAASGLSQIAAAYPDDTTALWEKIKADPDYTNAEKATLKALLSSAGSVKMISAGLTEGVEGLGKLSGGYSEIVKEAKSLPEGLAKAAAAAKELYRGTVDLADGAGQLSSATTQLADGTDELAQGLVTFDEQGVSKIVSMIDNDLGGLKKRLSALSDAATAYDNFSGKVAGTPSSVKFVFETAAIESD